MATFKLQVNSAKVSGTHTNFPAYVDLSKMPTSFWNTVSNGGGDIRCYSNEGLTTELPREVVSCDTSTDTGEIHVKTGLSTTTAIYITVDGTSTEPASDSTYGSENVWTKYDCVYHFQDLLIDSTANGKNLTNYGSVVQSDAFIEKGADTGTSNSNKHLSRVNDIGVSVGAVYMTAWIKPRATLSATSLFFETANATSNVANQMIYRGAESPKSLNWQRFKGNVSSDGFRYNINLSTSNYYKLTYYYNGSTLYGYLNGVEVGSASSSGSGTGLVNNSVIDLFANSTGGSANQCTPAFGDEYRISQQEFDSNWETTEYNNQSDVSTFWTITEVSSGTMIKRLNGILWANVKKVNGIAVANINKINGIEAGGTAPKDWHIPTDAEFTTLYAFLGGVSIAGGKMKQAGTVYWNSPNTGADNSSGFTALPGGNIESGPFGSEFGLLGVLASFWSSSEYNSYNSRYTSLSSAGSGVYPNYHYKENGYSVRCLRSVSPSESSDADGTIYTDDYTGNDGTKYDSVKIGNQIWINENLKETKYYDGTTIPRITDVTDWENDTTGARCEYNNDANSESDTYGYLYNWYAVGQAKGLINEDS